MYDAIVIGARCAGAPTAMLLARKGYRVLLADRSTFPRDIPHGHFIHRGGPRRLDRWGLLERIVSTNCPPVRTVVTDLDDFPLTGTDLAVDGIAVGYAPRRARLDQVLIDAAVEAGAELREGFAVEDFTTDGGRITGVKGRDLRRGAPAAELARITIGADGRNSLLAKAVRAPAYEEVPPVTCWYFSYWSGVPTGALEIYVRGKRIVFAFPTNDGLFGVFVAWPSAERKAVRADVEGQFMAVLDLVPDLAARIRGGRREERFSGATDVPNFLRKPYGPGWALVGDAGCHKDPYLALGICDAFRDAELLAEAVDEGLSGRGALDGALADYERRRDDATLADYRQNLQLARFEPVPAELAALRRALRGSPEDTRTFYLANEGAIPREAFFNPENLQRIMTGAMTRGQSS